MFYIFNFEAKNIFDIEREQAGKYSRDTGEMDEYQRNVCISLLKSGIKYLEDAELFRKKAQKDLHKIINC